MSIASGAPTSTPDALPRPTVTPATRKVTAFTSWAAKDRPPTPIARSSDSTTSASGPCRLGIRCIGCTEPDILFKLPIAEKVQIHEPTPFDSYAPANLKEKGKGPDPVTTGIVGLAAGAIIGAAVMMTRKLPARSRRPEAAMAAPNE